MDRKPINPYAAMGRGELLDLLGAVAQQLAALPDPEVIDAELAPVVNGRARRILAVPQWATSEGPRGIEIQAWSYQDRERAEHVATDRRQGSPTFGQVNEWRRMAEEVRLGIVSPPGLTAAIVQRWGYDVVRFIHGQIDRLGQIPAAVLAEELARAAGGPPPERAGRGNPGRNTPEPDPDELGDDPAAAGDDGPGDPGPD